MTNFPNPHRNIASNDNLELISFINDARKLAIKYGHHEIFACISQATIDMIENEFMRINKLNTCKIQQNTLHFIGDHRKYYYSNNGMVYRSDEYSLSFDAAIERIRYLKSLGLDGEMTGESIHFPGRTFGIIAWKNRFT
ncbi:MAG: hypothetical protein U0P46_08670 [Holophagaceae bacterium]